MMSFPVSSRERNVVLSSSRRESKVPNVMTILSTPFSSRMKNSSSCSRSRRKIGGSMGVTLPPPDAANLVPRARVVTRDQDWITPFVAHTTPLESWKLLIGA